VEGAGGYDCEICVLCKFVGLSDLTEEFSVDFYANSLGERVLDDCWLFSLDFQTDLPRKSLEFISNYATASHSQLEPLGSYKNLQMT
jgi:hypothetical protein